MSTPDTIQEAIEQRAKAKLNSDIEAFRSDFRDVLRKHNISNNISIKIVSEDGGSSRPFLSQILDCEAVVTAIIDRHLARYIRVEINRLLNKIDA